MNWENWEQRKAAQSANQPAKWLGGMEAIQADADVPRYAAAPDMVRQPSHYARYTIEPATFIAANKLPFDVGNVVKYVCRYDAKNGMEDLKKAGRYIEMIIERLNREGLVERGADAAAVWSKML